jgi:hypothetical protein
MRKMSSYSEKILNQQPQQTIQNEFFNRLRGLPFWILSEEEHAARYDEEKPFCCFNHAVSLPAKNGVKKPLFDYELKLIDALEQETKYLWIKKATGLGLTTLFLRWMTWVCTRDDAMRGKEMAIIVGPNLDLATGLINKIKALFIPHRITFDNKATEVIINDCLIKAYPSNHLDSMRSRMDLKVIFSDESDFYEPGERAILRDVVERYIAKSDPWIIMCSTPSSPDGLFAEMEQEEHSIYKRITMDYTVGAGRIYTEEEIARAKESPSFPREYECKYVGEVGNVFHYEDIQYAIEIGKSVNYNSPLADAPKAMGLDPGFGSSKFGIVITQLNYKEDRIDVIYAEQFENTRPTRILEVANELYQNYYVEAIYIDASNPGYISDLKEMVNDYPIEKDRWEALLKKATLYGVNPNHYMKVIPVSFGKYGVEMLTHAQQIVTERYLAIPPQFHDLIAQMNMATTVRGKEDSIRVGIR